jgi:acyl carrier protein
MRPEEVVAKVFSIAVGDVNDNTSTKTISNWDSYGHIALIVELESAYRVALSPEDTLAMADVASIKRVLRSYGATWSSM